jgi:hypothetical protein
LYVVELFIRAVDALEHVVGFVNFAHDLEEDGAVTGHRPMRFRDVGKKGTL